MFSLLTIYLGFIFWEEMFRYQTGIDLNGRLLLMLATVSVSGIQLWFRRIPDENINRYGEFGKVAFFLIFLAGIITIWATKIPWGRWRYREMLEVGDLSHFTPWYLPQGRNGHQSFISGHTALSFCVLPLVLLFMNNRKQYKIAWALALLWGALVALSRVVIGAHFPSDVLFGGGQTLLWFWFLRNRFVNAE